MVVYFQLLKKYDLQNRIYVAWAIAFVGLPAVLYPKSLGFLLWAIIPVVAWQEWMMQARVRDASRSKIWWLGVVLYALQLACVLFLASTWFWITAVIPVLLTVEALVRKVVSRWVSIGMLCTLLLPAFALPLLMNARLSVLIWCFIIPQLFDAFQYAVGRKWGRTPLSRWSPKKTWEGLLGGGVLAWASAMLLTPWLPWDTKLNAQMTLMLLAASYLGGLTSSMLKRLLGLKDWSKRLGSHGGLLDRIDSLIFSIPLAWIFYHWHLTTI